MGNCKCIKKSKWLIVTHYDPAKLWLVSRIKYMISKKGDISIYTKLPMFYVIHYHDGGYVVLDDREFDYHYKKIT
jgi:hypothetical protein